jgi:hypothetical protein
MYPVLLALASGVIPVLPLIVCYGNTVAAVLAALLLVCLACLWRERDRAPSAARGRPRRRPRRLSGHSSRLLPVGRSLS